MKKSFAALVTLFVGIFCLRNASCLKEMPPQAKQCQLSVPPVMVQMVIVLRLTFPRLAGQNAKYIYKQLHDFKSGLRNNALMMPMVADKTDQQMADLAVIFRNKKQVLT
jgi:hypothetical protein